MLYSERRSSFMEADKSNCRLEHFSDGTICESDLLSTISAV